ncbi:MAG TPA: excalibur calcium-binding domain-containing protein [Solirubrobacterales bacterium]|nr:excalibur calcium-binding domain-containing protein [Solirubrobacterales bacterium]
MKIRATITAAAVVLAVAFAASPASAADKDCSDFKTWREAQKFYKRHGGPQRDPHRLDGDDDGIACEALRY